MPYPWDQELNGGPGARLPAPPGVASGPIGRPPVGIIQPDPLPRPGTPMLLQSQQSGAPRPAMSPYSRPPRIGPAPGPANDLPSRFLGPPVREGFGTKPKSRITRPPIRETRPPQYGTKKEEREADAPHLPPQEPPVWSPPEWTPWDEAGGPGQFGTDQTDSPQVVGDPTLLPTLGPRKKPNGGNLPHTPGDNDFPPREQSFGRSEGWAGGGATAQETEEAARRRFGRWPGMADPQAPPAPVAPGQPSFNPFTGQWS